MSNQTKKDLLDKLEYAERYSRTAKVQRWLRRPFTHLRGFLLSYGLYPLTKKSYTRTAKIFAGDRMSVPLPAGLDLYLVGAKSHDSEIRLAKYLIKHVDSNATVFDVGAHVGYYSSLCCHLAMSGKVYSFEPSSMSFSILKKNLRKFPNCSVVNKAVSDKTGVTEIYQLPQLYSEFDTIASESLSSDLKAIATPIEIDTTTIDDYCLEHNCKPDIIKIDVEGAEHSVLKGATKTLDQHRPIVAMEVRKEGFDILYGKISETAKELGYQFYRITKYGEEEPIDDLKTYILGLELESDNVVLRSA